MNQTMGYIHMKRRCFRDHLYITSEKGLGGWGRKMAIFADVQYCICADIVDGWVKKVQKCAHVIQGWSICISVYQYFVFTSKTLPILKLSFLTYSPMLSNSPTDVLLKYYLIRTSTHCSKMKMNGKKLSRFQFNSPGLLGTSPMSKQERIFFSIIGLWR